MSNTFFQQINYASATEDGAAEVTALQLTEADNVLCVTASGARPLDLIATSDAQVTSVDFSGPQNYLLDLKMAAYQYLDYSDFEILLGIRESERTRITKLINSLLPYLDSASARYWKKSHSSIHRGILYCGTWERLLWWISRTAILRSKQVHGLFDSSDLESQIDYWNRNWRGGFLKTFLKLLSNRVLWTHIIREPGAKLIPKDFDVATYMMDCLERMVHHSLMRTNPYANLLFYGQYTNRCLLPIHLREESFEILKQRISRIQWRTIGLRDHLQSCENSYSAFSLSDFSSYATQKQYEDVWEAVIKNAAPNARYCERHFLVKRNWDHPALTRDKSLEDRIFQLDHTCLYTFHAGHIHKP